MTKYKRPYVYNDIKFSLKGACAAWRRSSKLMPFLEATLRFL